MAREKSITVATSPFFIARRRIIRNGKEKNKSLSSLRPTVRVAFVKRIRELVILINLNRSWEFQTVPVEITFIT